MKIRSTEKCASVAERSHSLTLCKHLCLVLSVNSSNGGATFYIFALAGIMVLVILGVQAIDLISSRRRKEQQISSLRSEIESLEKNTTELVIQNDWLVTEMHHRVKNNLQILSSLINSQLSFIKDKSGRDILFNSKHRLFALSIVHQKLFQNAVTSRIEISGCIVELVKYLTDELDAGEHIRFEMDLIPIDVDISFAIAFELIMNELLTNTLKFAFPDTKAGTVKISLSRIDEDRYMLLYADDGVGLPEEVDFLSGNSLGRSLILGLSQQIKAEISVARTNGLEIKINFKTARG